MASLIFHYKENANYGCFYPAAEHPRDYLSSTVLAVYDDGKIISYDRNCLNEKINERIICENISVTNKIDKLLEDNKWKKQLKKDKVYEWRKYVRYGRAINRFRDIYDEVRKILIDAGMPENLMTE